MKKSNESTNYTAVNEFAQSLWEKRSIKVVFWVGTTLLVIWGGGKVIRLLGKCCRDYQQGFSDMKSSITNTN
jgi:hypothetical protein